MKQQAAPAPLYVQGVHKRFGANTVLEDVSFELKAGEIFGLIGLNGVGKTTLIKIILDLLAAETGKVLLSGKAHREPLARRHVCYLPEKLSPNPNIKGLEYIRYVAGFFGVAVSRAQAEVRAKEMDLPVIALNQRVAKYSKGMTQKLGVVASMFTNAPLLILDEPMSGLDPKARILLKRQMAAHKMRGGTVFFSSHILADLEEMCDRIAVLHNKKLLYVGNPQRFITTYHPMGGLEKAFLKALIAHPVPVE